MSVPATSSFYVTGGTLQHDAASYVARQADTDLYQGLIDGEYCYILTARQMGKSSLMARTAHRLREEGYAVVILDLAAIGQNLSPEQWYDGLREILGQHLELEEELDDFWLANTRLGPLQRWVAALRQVVLARVPGRVVIFIDEIDAVRSLPFSADEFFAAIRECYNRRTEDPEFRRLTFCLLGVASPADLIRDTRITPFNIGRRIELTDFSEVEALPLAEGLHYPSPCPLPETERGSAAREAGDGLRLPEISSPSPPRGGGRGRGNAGELLQRILYWTGGHPYLTQRLCRAVAEHVSAPTSDSRHPTPDAVDGLCETLFLSPSAQERDDNLLFVRERLLRGEADPASLLDLYAKVRRGQRVANEETNPLVSLLRLSGITRVVDGSLQLRNRIYARVFDLAWVTARMPDAELRRQRSAYRRGLLRTAAVASVIVAAMGMLAFSRAQLAEERKQERDRVTRLLYVADMNVAQRTWQERNVTRTEELLDAHRPKQRDEDDLRGFEWRYWWRLCQGDALFTFPGRLEQAGASVVFLPDSQIVAASQAGGAISLWNVTTRHAVGTLQGDQRALWSLAVTPDGRTLAAGYADGPIQLWDVASRQTAGTLAGASTTNGTSSLAFSPNGRTLATHEFGDAAIHLWDLRTRRQLAPLPADPKVVWSVAFAPNGQLASGGGDGLVKLWDVATRRVVATLAGHKEPVAAVAFSRDGRILASVGESQTVKLWDVTRRRPLVTLRHPQPVVERVRMRDNIGSKVALSPDCRILATANQVESTITVWDVVAEQVAGILKGHRDGIGSLAISSDGKILASGSEDGTVKLWNARPTSDETFLRSTGREVHSLAFSADGQTLAAGTDDGAVKLWEVGGGQGARVARPVGGFPIDLKGHSGTIRAVAFSPRGEVLASAGDDRVVRIWNARSRQQRAVLSGHRSPVWSLAFSPDGQTLATGSEDRAVRLWNIATGRMTATLQTEMGLVRSLAFSPDGRSLALGGEESSVNLWSVAGQREIAALSGHEGPLTSVAFSPDGRTLVTGGSDGTARLWDVRTHREIASLRGHERWVAAVAFCPDGKTVASGSSDRTVRLWNVATGREAATLKGASDEVSSVAFSPDGTVLAAGSKDGAIRLWRAATLADADAEAAAIAP